MFAYRLDCLIDASGGFDHCPTGRDLAILGLPLAVKLRERRQWIERSTVSGVIAGASLAALNVEIAIGTCRHHLPMVANGGHPCQRQSASTRSHSGRWFDIRR